MNPIGFNPLGNWSDMRREETQKTLRKTEIKPTIVQIFFPDRNRTLAYYNDRFDLRVGDIVFVDGKLEGLRGQVTAVSTRFKVKAEDYKRVIGVADTRVVGRFFQADAFLITFEPQVLSWKQFCSWAKPPAEDEIEYYISYDEEGFPLDDFSRMKVSKEVLERGGYYRENRVVYLCLDGGQGWPLWRAQNLMKWSSSTKEGRSAACPATAPVGTPASMRRRCCSSSGRRWKPLRKGTRVCGLTASTLL